MKIAIYADPVMGKGGGSKVTIQLANALNADIITAGVDEELLRHVKKNIKVINIGNLSIKKNHPFGFLFEAPIRYIFCKYYKYDVKIFIGSSCIFASRKKDKNIWFSLTPNRIMYDLKKWKLENASFAKRIALASHILLFNKLDQHVVKNNFDRIVAQTNTVKSRIKKYYSRDSKIIYSPVQVANFKFHQLGDFFLAVSRLQPEKRIDLIAKAFSLEDKKLVIVGSGPETSKIEKIIANSKNITMLNFIDDKGLIELYSSCRATIYIPINEDFGLVPIESMASGKICIAVNEGGCKETILNRKTGYLINPTVADLRHTINTINNRALLGMKKACIARAREFDIGICINQWKKVINSIAI